MNLELMNYKKRRKKGTSKYQQLRIYKNMDNLHFVPNNILIRIFKQLTKYKNDYQQYLNYIGRNYTMPLNVYLLNISMHMHGLQASLYTHTHTHINKQNLEKSPIRISN